MSQNPGERLAQVHDAIMLRVQIAAGVVSTDSLGEGIESYYQRCIDEGAMPLSAIKYIHEILQNRYLRDETTPTKRDMIDVAIKEGFGIGLMIGSTMLEADQRLSLFELFNERLFGLSNAPTSCDLEALLALEGKPFTEEIRELGPNVIFEPYCDGPSPEYDDFRNQVFANALGYSAQCAVVLLEMQSLEISDFTDFGI